MYSIISDPANKKTYSIKSKKGISIFKKYLQQIGGKYVAKGTYKCVHSPPISCDDTSNKYKSTDYVSSLTTYGEAMNALQNEDIKMKIDPDNQFTIKLLKTCNVGTLDSIKESANEFKECTSIYNGNFLSNYTYPFEYYDYDADDDLRLLIFKHGGLDLVELTNKLKNTKLNKLLDIIPNLFGSFKYIFYGLLRFKQEKFMHSDIKPNNIVYNIKGKRFNIIDLGLMVSFNNALKDEYFMRHTINIPSNAYYYRYWPVDAGVASLFLDRKKRKTGLNFSPPISQGPNPYNNVRNPKNIRKLYYDNISDVGNFIKVSKEKFDTYSLGVTIKEFFYSKEFNSIVNKIVKKYPTNSKIQKIKHIRPALMALADKMTEVDPLKRISIEGAYKEYMAMVDSL